MVAGLLDEGAVGHLALTVGEVNARFAQAGDPAAAIAATTSTPAGSSIDSRKAADSPSRTAGGTSPTPAVTFAEISSIAASSISSFVRK